MVLFLDYGLPYAIYDFPNHTSKNQINTNLDRYNELKCLLHIIYNKTISSQGFS